MLDTDTGPEHMLGEVALVQAEAGKWVRSKGAGPGAAVTFWEMVNIEGSTVTNSKVIAMAGADTYMDGRCTKHLT